MPGLFGIIATQQSASNRRNQVEAMFAAVKTKELNGGTYHSDSLPVSIAWTALPGSFSDSIPIWNERRDVCLFLSGEVFSDPKDIAAVKERGHDIAFNHSSHLVHLFEELGIDFIRRLNGWFVGVLLDLRAGEAFLFNDRWGFKRLYTANTPQGFYFASEAKAIHRIFPHTRSLQSRSLGELISCGCPLKWRSLYNGLSLLPGGSLGRYRDGEVYVERYFLPEEYEKQAPLSSVEFQEHLIGSFEKVLPFYFRPSETIGMSLTGGMDGRMIMAWAKSAPGALPCYTFGGTYRDCTDVKLARRIADLCNQPHSIIPVGTEFLRKFSEFADEAILSSDGAMDVSGAAEVYANRLAREIAPVRLTGNYGSEILRGTIAFKPKSKIPPIFDPELDSSILSAERSYLEESQCHPLTFVAFKQVPWHHFSRFSVEEAQLSPRSPFLDNELVKLMYRAPRGLLSSKEPSFRLIQKGNPVLAEIPTDRGLRPTPSVFGKVEHAYQEFTFRAEYAYDYGMPQWLAKFDNFFGKVRLERLFLGRHKFCHFRTWYRHELAPYVKEMLLDQRSLARPYLRRKQVERIVADHTAGRGNYTTEIHQLLTLELIHRQLLERN